MTYILIGAVIIAGIYIADAVIVKESKNSYSSKYKRDKKL